MHPGAWWLWACFLAAATTFTTNPVVLAVVLGIVGLTVAARRPDAPWARSFRFYLWFGAFVIVMRVLLFVVVGDKSGPTVLFTLPAPPMPSWAAGIQLLGPIPLEGLVGALAEGLRLATMFVCLGAANALANPRRLLKALPAALRDIGTAVVVAVTVVPQMVTSVRRVMHARALRGTSVKGVKAIRVVAIPVLQDTLDRSLLLAASMDARGFGTRKDASKADRLLVSGVSLLGLMAVCVGVYGLLDQASAEGFAKAWTGPWTIAVGLGLGALGIWLGGRRIPRSVYRPDPWKGAEWFVVGCGFAAFVVAFGVLHGSSLTDRLGITAQPLAAIQPIEPIAWPQVPVPLVLGLLVAALPAFLTPNLPPPPQRLGARRPEEHDVVA